MKNTETENGSLVTLEKLEETLSLKQTAGPSEAHASPSLSPDAEQDWGGSQVSLEKFLESLPNKKKMIDPNGLSMKMLKESLPLTKDLITLQYSVSWTHLGMMQNGVFSTQKISEQPKVEKGFILSDILEPEVASTFFLSKKQTDRLVLKL